MITLLITPSFLYQDSLLLGLGIDQAWILWGCDLIDHLDQPIVDASIT
ncbi:MAG: Uncharacterised protein [Prochlorococcus marinus str. MIT 9215]|nr:MAG: Uncharacterised protein [Prochlorococcus marinus str. MIT 9215]